MACSTLTFADQYVRPYVRSDGTLVNGYMRTEPNSTRFDNYSAQGNTNPYTGQPGYGRSELSNPPGFNYGNNGSYGYGGNGPYGYGR